MKKFIKLLDVRKTIKHLSKKQLILIGAGAVVVGGIALTSIIGGDKLVTVEVKRGDIQEEVQATGKTKSSSEVNLGFERSGKVVSANREVGDQVVTGDNLITLDQTDLRASLLKAQANLSKAEVELNTIKRTSPLSYENAFEVLNASIRDAYNAADNAVRNDTDQFFTNPRTYYASFNPSFEDGGTTYLGGLSPSIKSEISSDRVEIEALLTTWERHLGTARTDAEISVAFSEAQSDLLKIRSFLDKIASAINSLKSTEFTYDSTIQGYKTTVSGARTDISSALNTLLTANDKFNKAPKATVSLASYDEVSKQEAVVESFRADLASIQADISKTVLRAPISGTITRFDAEVGEIVTTGNVLVSIISEDKLQIETNISEINIGKVRVGNEASITFDAFPNQVYQGKVIYIDPGETLVDKVPTYKVTVAFNGAVPSEILSGLTTNLRISTNKKTDVLSIPAYATKREGEKTFVTVIKDGKEEKREITVGLRGNNGMIEVLSGLDEGEILSVKK
jgi:HlyD family secretion protein